jgi:hypothetical protein
MRFLGVRCGVPSSKVHVSRYFGAKMSFLAVGAACVCLECAHVHPQSLEVRAQRQCSDAGANADESNAVRRASSVAQ